MIMVVLSIVIRNSRLSVTPTASSAKTGVKRFPAVADNNNTQTKANQTILLINVIKI